MRGEPDHAAQMTAEAGPVRAVRAVRAVDEAGERRPWVAVTAARRLDGGGAAWRVVQEAFA